MLSLWPTLGMHGTFLRRLAGSHHTSHKTHTMAGPAANFRLWSGPAPAFRARVPSCVHGVPGTSLSSGVPSFSVSLQSPKHNQSTPRSFLQLLCCSLDANHPIPLIQPSREIIICSSRQFFFSPAAPSPCIQRGCNPAHAFARQ